jgi:hypothetical protein
MLTPMTKMGRAADCSISLAKRSQNFNSRPNYIADSPMINFIEGQINLGAKGISALSDYDDLDDLAKEGLIEKKKRLRWKRELFLH